MQFENQTGGAGAIQGDDPRRDSGADRDGADGRAKPAAVPRVTVPKSYLAARKAARKVPAPAEPAPLVELLAPLEGAEPFGAKRDENRPPVIYGSHGQPVKKRDLRNRRGRKRPPYVPRGNPIGNQTFVPTPAQRSLVIVLAGMKVRQAIIASMIGDEGISEPTLIKHFGRELALAKQKLIANVKALLVQAAQNGNVRAQIWLLEHLDPDFCGNSPGDGGIDMGTAAVINASGEPGVARVTVFLPDNQRTANRG